MPTFEEIFEVDHSATTEAAQHVLLNLNPASGGSAGGQTGLTFSNQLEVTRSQTDQAVLACLICFIGQAAGLGW